MRQLMYCHLPQLEGNENELLNSTILGDVVISLETAERQAIDESHSLEEEVAFLTGTRCASFDRI